MYHFHIFFDTYFFMHRSIYYNHLSTIALTWQFHFSIPFHVVIHNICHYEALKLKKNYCSNYHSSCTDRNPDD